MASRVLIVDDDEGTRAGLAQLLEQAGYEATTVGRFQDALRIVRTNPPDLLITDVRLEAYNGLQLVLSSPHHVPAIVITGFADPVLETEARRRGAEYLLKPVSPGLLLTLVEEKLAAAKAGFPLPRRWPRKQIVGVNAFIETDEEPIPILYIDDTAAETQLRRLEDLKKTRDAARVAASLDALRAAARGRDNTMYPLLECVRAYATIGEMCDALRDVWGEWEEEPLI